MSSAKDRRITARDWKAMHIPAWEHSSYCYWSDWGFEYFSKARGLTRLEGGGGGSNTTFLSSVPQSVIRLNGFGMLMFLKEHSLPVNVRCSNLTDAFTFVGMLTKKRVSYVNQTRP
jgi:hypothetical protein